MPSQAVQELVRELTAAMKPGVPIEEQRAAYNRCFSRFAAPDDVRVEATTVGGVPAEWVIAPGAGPAVVLYLHGGGYMLGSPSAYRAFGAGLSRASGARVLLLD